MKQVLQQYRPFLLFLGKFFLSYFVLTAVYRMYLSSFGKNVMDGITTNVSFLTEKLANILGINIATQSFQDYYKIFYQGKYVARIIEGCNAISVIILFVAFVIAFSGRLKPTLFFAVGGGLFLYIVNVFRIIILAVLLFWFPNQVHLLHGVLFPLLIYGMVFLLWIVWVNKYSVYASNHKK